MNPPRSLTVASLAALLSGGFVAARAPLSPPAFLVVSAASALGLAALLAAVRPLSVAGRGALVGLGLATAPLYVLGKVLKATTHHRPLGAVTFAFLALFVLAAAVTLAIRIVGARSDSSRARLVSLALEGSAGVAAALALYRPLRGAATQGGAVDVAFALGTAAVLTLLPWPERVRSAADRVGPWLWGGIVLLGFAFALGPARGVASSSSPALAAALGWF